MTTIRYRTTPQSLTDGQVSGELACDVNGNLKTAGDNITLLPITFVLDTLIHAAGDVLAVPTVLTAFTEADGYGILQSIVLNDKDDQGIALYVVVMDSNPTLGALNAACAITDANADFILGIIPVETTDWFDIGGCRIATIRNIGLPIKSVSGLTTLYLALVTRGTPTHAGASMTARVGIARN